MDSASLTQSAVKLRCLCAICTRSFQIQEDNLQRRRNLHDFCRLIETSEQPPMEPEKKEELFDLLEDKLKKRRLVSLCEGCDAMITSLLREREGSRECEAAVMHQQQDLWRHLAALQRHNCTVTQHFTSIQDVVETARNDDLQLNEKPELAAGLNLFRNRLIEISKELQKNSGNMSIRQLSLPGPSSASATRYSGLQLQQAIMSTTPPTSGLLALPPVNEVRKRPSNGESDASFSKPAKKPKTTAVGQAEGPQKPNFKAGIIFRASKVEDVASSSTIELGYHSNFQYDAKNDSLSFGGRNIAIDDKNRHLICECGYDSKQTEKNPSNYYSVERNIKRHVLHAHLNIWEFHCRKCGKGFCNMKGMERHLAGCTASMNSIPQTNNESVANGTEVEHDVDRDDGGVGQAMMQQDDDRDEGGLGQAMIQQDVDRDEGGLGQAMIQQDVDRDDEGLGQAMMQQDDKRDEGGLGQAKMQQDDETDQVKMGQAAGEMQEDRKEQEDIDMESEDKMVPIDLRKLDGKNEMTQTNGIEEVMDVDEGTNVTNEGTNRTNELTNGTNEGTAGVKAIEGVDDDDDYDDDDEEDDQMLE